MWTEDNKKNEQTVNKNFFFFFFLGIQVFKIFLLHHSLYVIRNMVEHADNNG